MVTRSGHNWELQFPQRRILGGGRTSVVADNAQVDSSTLAAKNLCILEFPWVTGQPRFQYLALCARKHSTKLAGD
jgi:hypothetical protein